MKTFQRQQLAEATILAVETAENMERAEMAPILAGAQAETPAAATQTRPWKNSLGMVFVPVTGTKVFFSIWKTRVQDYAAYAQENPSVNMEWKKPEFLNKEWKKSEFQQGPTHPVVNVSWEDAKAFCAWLTKKDQALLLLGPNQKYRLPTDEEWSVAVGLPIEGDGTPRDKNITKFVFPWGTGRDQLPPPRGVGNYESTDFDDFEYTSPVWAFKPNSFGLHDIGGNAFDWCEDWFDRNQKERVLRGGSWRSGIVDFVCSTYRNFEPPNRRGDQNSFRCVLVLEGDDRQRQSQ